MLFLTILFLLSISCINTSTSIFKTDDATTLDQKHSTKILNTTNPENKPSTNTSYAKMFSEGFLDGKIILSIGILMREKPEISLCLSLLTYYSIFQLSYDIVKEKFIDKTASIQLLVIKNFLNLTGKIFSFFAMMFAIEIIETVNIQFILPYAIFLLFISLQ